ncbi:MAG: ABC transporter ATP-binding protein [Pirellulales bacterium]
MFRLEDVTKIYTRHGKHVAALRSTTLEIPRGDYAAVVGPSGSGKTTLLSVLGGMLSPNAGKVFIDGESLYEQTIARRAELRRNRIGFVFQTFNLVPYLTALENVQVPLYLAGVESSLQAERARELLTRVGLGERLDHKPSELSTGQQQRVALARTLANDPQIVLADEPTGNLDPESRRVVLAFLDELHAEGRTIVMVTHDPAAAERAERWLRLADGAVTAAPVGQLLSAA